MPYAWQRKYTGSHSISQDSATWDEVYHVYGYEWAADGNPLVDLLAPSERPDLAPGKPHPVVPNAYVDDFVPARLGSSKMAEVTVTYSSSPADERDVSPLDRPTKWTLGSETIEVPTLVRLDGSLIQNTAGDLIHGQVRKVNRRIFNFEKNVAAFPSWLLDYSDNAVNSDNVTIEGIEYQPGYLMLRGLTAGPYEYETVNNTTVAYRVLTGSLVYDPRGWDEKIYNRGLRELREVTSSDSSSGVTSLPAGSGSSLSEASSSGDTPTYQLVWICDEDEDGTRTPIDEPQFLDADGRRLSVPVSVDDVIELDGVGVNSLPFASVLPI